MFCAYCGNELPENAKFCPACGASLATASKSIPAPTNTPIEIKKYGTLRIYHDYKYSNRAYRNAVVSVYVDYETHYEVTTESYLEEQIPCGRHLLVFVVDGKAAGKQEISIAENAYTDFKFVINGSGNRVPSVEVIGLNAGAQVVKATNTCPKCGGNMSVQTVAESKSSGCLAIILHIILCILTAGIWLVVLLLRKRTQTVSYMVCQNCGYKKQIGRPI